MQNKVYFGGANKDLSDTLIEEILHSITVKAVGRYVDISDIDDSGKFSDDTLGGDEKTISFVANLKNSKDNPTSADMIGSFSKHLRDYYGGKGDVIPQGVGAGLKTGDHLKNTMIYNQYKGNTIQELSRAAYSTDGTTVQMKDEDAFNLLAGKAAKKGMRVDDYIRYYGKEKI